MKMKDMFLKHFLKMPPRNQKLHFRYFLQEEIHALLDQKVKNKTTFLVYHFFENTVLQSKNEVSKFKIKGIKNLTDIQITFANIKM